MAMIDILLATYNGSAYLGELLDSLESQTFQDWRLVVRDDGSSDDSLEIVSAWARRRRQPVEIVSDALGPLGACGSFAALLEHSRTPYFALCDQDDVWLPAKLVELLACMQQTEPRSDSATPILAHSDLTVVNAQLRPLHQSFRAYKGFQAGPDACSLRKTILQNRITGCATLGNAALRNAALPIPNNSMMHDWWLAMVATAFGEVVEHPLSLVLYRQHGENVIGARSWRPSALAHRFVSRPLAMINDARTHVSRTQERARAFVERFAGRLDPGTETLLRAYASLNERDIWHRKAFLFRSGMWTSSPVANLGLLAVI